MGQLEMDEKEKISRSLCFEDDFGVAASSRGCHSGLGRLLFNGLASLQYCRYCVEAPDRPVRPDGLFWWGRGRLEPHALASAATSRRCASAIFATSARRQLLS